MSIVISPIPNKDAFDVWINGRHLIMSTTDLIALHDATSNVLRMTK